jgi:signal transduction histidine kinase
VGARARGEGRPLFRSLRLRMAVSHGAVLALILLILGWVGYVLLAANLDHEATGEVLVAARSEIDRVSDSGRVMPPTDTDVPSSSAIREAVFLPGGRIVGDTADVPPWLRPQRREVSTIRVRGEDVRVATLELRVGGGPTRGTIVAAKSLAPEAALLHRVRLLLILGGLAGVAASMVAGWILSGRAARPVRRAYEAQAAFASDASHELRTPLAFVQSGVEVLSEHDPDLGSDVLREIGYLTSITERLLTMARTQGGRVQFDVRPVDIGTVCRRAAERNGRALGVRVDVAVPVDAVAMADAVTLEAALDVVLENVSRHGGGRAAIDVVARDGAVVVSVADHGPGLPAELRTRVFDRFVRADPARSRASGGAGLGLPLARTLIEAQHGRIWLDETPGGGVTARIQLRAGPETRATA